MPVRVLLPPDPIVIPADVPGSHSPDDATVEALIAAATGTIDGPDGWLGRSFGPQTLELSVSCWSDISKLPYGPVINVDVIRYVASDGSEVVLDDSSFTLDGDFIYFDPSWAAPALSQRAYPIKVQYQAGYDGNDVYSGGTGDVPQQARAAIIEAVQQLVLSRSQTLSARSIEIPDVETLTFLDADKISALMRKSAEGLLSGLWVPRI